MEGITRTPVSMEEVKRRLSKYVSQPALGYLVSMIAFENDHGRAIYEHNWGNISTNNHSEENSFQFPGNPIHFKRLHSPEAGVDAFWRRLHSKTHKRILDAARRDDFDGFYRGIVVPHPKTKMVYCHDCGPAVRNTYRQLTGKFVEHIGGSSGSSGVLVLFGLAALGAGFYFWKSKGASRA